MHYYILVIPFLDLGTNYMGAKTDEFKVFKNLSITCILMICTLLHVL